MLTDHAVSRAVNTKANLQTLLNKNKCFSNDFQNNALMQLIRSNNMKEKSFRTRLLDAVQLFSDHFQKCVMMRHILTDNGKFKAITQQHLDEEYNHNVTLLSDRNYKPPIWDPILEATSSWFTWKMLSLDHIEKTVIVHLVLEESADIFFSEANNVMTAYGETNYFNIHAEVDGEHKTMGIQLLEDLREAEYIELLKIQQQAWDVLNAACARIGQLVHGEKTNSEPLISLKELDTVEM